MLYKKYRTVFRFTFLLIVSGCVYETPLPGETQTIIFLGHTYQKRDRMDRRLEKVNYKKYDQIWLGGDMCSETTEEYSTLKYLDNHFRLGDPRTHWAVGNHDVRNGNTNWITEYTGRDLFYASSDQGLTVLVLNTNFEDPDCGLLEAQYNLMTTVLDTLQTSSHLVVLTHHCIWGDAVAGQDMWMTANGNKPFWRSLCTEGSEFMPDILPRLKAVQARGVQVICLAGDFGQRVKAFEYRSAEGIWFLGSGLNKGLSNEIDPDDQAMILTFDPVQKSLEWEFVAVTELASR
ncbi:MAG: metallophosphoesterase [Bacteroidia bacterium]|nr:metallophosphoesterase [Bacteroidia bacterium]